MDALLTELAERSDADKGDRGRVGVIAGSIDKTGPPALVGEAALRAGSDLVEILTSEEVLSTVAGYSENLTVDRYTGDYLSVDSVSKATTLGEWSDVLVVGPGLSDPDGEAIRTIVSEVSVPVVVDSTAIEPALDESLSATVFTPDTAEVEIIESAYGSLAAFSKETGAVVLSSGSTDEIVAGDESWQIDAGTSAMTVAGTGDTLAGVTASVLGQGLDRTEAARLGAWVTGMAGEYATERYGNGVMATDIIERVPDAMAV
jgi:hydroxyethylthiazole kinase-like uncharacterized protein yjeF